MTVTTHVRLPLRVFPARVVFSDGRTFLAALVYLIETRMLVYVAAGKTAELVSRETVTGVTLPTGRQPYEVAFPEGSATVARSGGCGCGSKLRSFPIPPEDLA